MSDEPRQFTVEEIREQFLHNCWSAIDYWAGLHGSNVPPERPCRERISGAVFSILAALDGCSLEIPGFVVAPSPHPDDEEYCKAEGENWYPRVESEFDIGGGLHERFHSLDPERKGS